MCSGASLARCYFEANEIDQLKPGLKSMAQHFFFCCCYLKSALVICSVVFGGLF